MSFQDTTPQENVTQAILPADRIVCVTFSEETQQEKEIRVIRVISG
jgi:hypothetical protein